MATPPLVGCVRSAAHSGTSRCACLCVGRASSIASTQFGFLTCAGVSVSLPGFSRPLRTTMRKDQTTAPAHRDGLSMRLRCAYAEIICVPITSFRRLLAALVHITA